MIDPLFDPNDVLPNDPYLQIPLDAQPIDLPGLGAQGRQQQWIHPDNIIPTTASMHGQKYSNPQQAQVATFNDDKRLRVDATVAGGGSGFTGTKAQFATIGSGSHIDTVNRRFDYPFSALTNGVIFGYAGWARPDVGVAAGDWDGWVDIGVCDNNGAFVLVGHMHVAMYYDPAIAGIRSVTGPVTFPYPLDITGQLDFTNTFGISIVNNTNVDIIAFAYVWGI